MHEPAVAHPMATVGAALVAEAGRGEQVTGAEFLAAMVAGVNVVATLAAMSARYCSTLWPASSAKCSFCHALRESRYRSLRIKHRTGSSAWLMAHHAAD